MEALEKRVLDTIRDLHMIRPGERVLVGVSGGADSVCLLAVLCALRETLGCSLSVVHVNHGMRAEAAEDEAFVHNLAGRLELPFYAEHVDVPALERMWHASPEEAARRARFEAFARVRTECGADLIALAHNRDDQAETVLLKLFRGAGLRGLAGMAPVREVFIRPLLYTPRADIEEYLRAKNLSHIEDASNAGDAYTRNRLRHNLLPLAQREINSQAALHTAKAADHVQEAISYISEQAEAAYRHVKVPADDLPQQVSSGSHTDVVTQKGNTGIADISVTPEPNVALRAGLLSQEHPYLQKEILFLWLREVGIREEIDQTHMDALLALISSTDGSKEIDLPGGIRIIREYDTLRILSLPAENGTMRPTDKKQAGDKSQIASMKDGMDEIPLPGLSPGRTAEITLPGTGTVRISLLERSSGGLPDEIPTDSYTKWFDFDKIKRSLCFRRRQTGDWIDTGNGRKSLKKELIDRRIPATRRDDLYLLAADSEILWIPGIRRCEAYKVTAETHHILQIFLEEFTCQNT